MLLSLRYTNSAGNQEGGTNFTWRVSKPSSVGKILKDPSEERKKETFCRGYRVNHEKAYHDSEENKNDGKRKLAFGVKLKPG